MRARREAHRERFAALTRGAREELEALPEAERARREAHREHFAALTRGAREELEALFEADPRPGSSRQTELRQIAHRRKGEEDAYWRSEFAARRAGTGRGVEEAYWRQFLEEISGISREEQDADLEAVPGGYGLSSIASLWRAESQSLEEDAV